MPISDTYVVQYLLQTTGAEEQQISWREKESGGYAATVNGIEIELGYLLGRTESRLCISLSSVMGKVQIEEPRNIGLFREKYENEDQRCLVQLMKELAATVAGQCSGRQVRSEGIADNIRQTLYKRLIGAFHAEG